MYAPPPKSSNRTLWIVLGVVGGVLFLCCAGGFFLFSRGLKAFQNADAEADRYAAESMVAVAKPWNADALWSRGSSAYKAAVSQQGNREIVAKFSSALGNLKSCGPFSASKTYLNSRNGASRVEVEASAEATFEKGPAHVTLGMSKSGDAWQIDSFYLGSPKLLKS